MNFWYFDFPLNGVQLYRILSFEILTIFRYRFSTVPCNFFDSEPVKEFVIFKS